MFQLIGCVCGIIWLTVFFENPDTNQYNSSIGLAYLQLVWTTSVVYRGTHIFKLFDRTRELYSIIEVSVQDSLSFMMLVGFLIFSFGLIRSMLDFPNNHDMSYEFGMMFSDILGGFDAPGTGDEYQPGKWVAFCLSLTYIMVIAMNSLIAILGDSFDKVQSDLRSYDSLQKI
jgi:hypothetical protein